MSGPRSNGYARPRVIMFDLDGTLVDTMFAFADLAAEVMATHHGAQVDEGRRRYLETSGIPFARQLEVICPRHASNSRASEEFEQRKRAITRSTPLDDRTVAGLETLRALGFELVVSSNTGQDFVDEFVRSETVRFDLALGFDEAAGLAKGEPHVARTLAHFSVQRSEILFVGDSLTDGELAEHCGIAFVGRLGTFDDAAFDRAHPAAATVSHIDELPGLISPTDAG